MSVVSIETQAGSAWLAGDRLWQPYFVEETYGPGPYALTVQKIAVSADDPAGRAEYLFIDNTGNLANPRSRQASVARAAGIIAAYHTGLDYQVKLGPPIDTIRSSTVLPRTLNRPGRVGLYLNRRQRERLGHSDDAVAAVFHAAGMAGRADRFADSYRRAVQSLNGYGAAMADLHPLYAR